MRRRSGRPLRAPASLDGAVSDVLGALHLQAAVGVVLLSRTTLLSAVTACCQSRRPWAAT